MSFLPEAQPPSPSPLLLELYGFVPRLFRVLGQTPDLLEKQVELLSALLSGQGLSRIQTEQVLLAVSAALRCPYGVALHDQMLRLLGESPASADRIVQGLAVDGEAGPLILAARKLILTPALFSGKDVDGLRQAGLAEAEIVQLVIGVASCAFLTTVAFGAGVQPDFAVRPIPEQAPENKMYPEESETRLIVEAIQEDPDGEWVTRVQQGDVDAFETLVTRHNQRIYRTMVSLLGNPDEARDAVQEIFLKAFQNLSAFQRKSKFSTWLTSIACNTGFQLLRDRKQIDSLDDEATEAFRPRQIRAWADDPEQVYSRAEQRAVVERCVMRLPVKYRVVLVMRDIDGVSTEEAAAALGLGVPALKARLLRGRLMLREALAPHFSAGAEPA